MKQAREGRAKGFGFVGDVFIFTGFVCRCEFSFDARR
jgi:hypothetical protein